MYRVVLRARASGTWDVYFFEERQQLFHIPFRKDNAAFWTAARIADDLLRNQVDFSCSVQDEAGQTIPVDLLKVAQKRKVRES